MFSRKTTFLTAVLETALVVAVSLGILLVPLTVLWAVENNSSIDWTAAYRASADIWLAAHGVPIAVAAQSIAGVGVPEFLISMVPLGYSLGIGALTFKMGQRLATGRALWPGWLGAIAVYGAASLFIADSAKHTLATPVANLAAFLPTIVFTLVLLASSLLAKPASLGIDGAPEARERTQFRAWFGGFWENLGWWANVVAPPALRAGTAIVVMLLGFSAAVLSIITAVNWIEVIRLYEGLQLTLLGGVLVTIGQIAFLPNIVVFTADWFTGAGFAIGTGSSVSPMGTNLGPLPSLPILASLPSPHLSLGLVALAVPAVASVVATVRIKEHAGAMRFEFASPFTAALSLGIPVALVAAIEFLVINLVARGSLGPGRLVDVGGNPLLAAGALFGEVALLSTIAAFYAARPVSPDSHLIERARNTVVTRTAGAANKGAKPSEWETDYSTTRSKVEKPATASGFEPEDNE